MVGVFVNRPLLNLKKIFIKTKLPVYITKINRLEFLKSKILEKFLFKNKLKKFKRAEKHYLYIGLENCLVDCIVLRNNRH